MHAGSCIRRLVNYKTLNPLITTVLCSVSVSIICNVIENNKKKKMKIIVLKLNAMTQKEEESNRSCMSRHVYETYELFTVRGRISENGSLTIPLLWLNLCV